MLGSCLLWLGLIGAQTVPVEPDLGFVVDLALRGERLYVVDFSGHACWALDVRTGRGLRRYGRFGQGPGEIAHPEKVWIDNERLWLFSHETKRIVVFDLETAEALETIRVQASGFAVGLVDGQVIMAGHSPGRFDPEAPVVGTHPIVSTPSGRMVVAKATGRFGASYRLAQKARGWLQQHLALWAPERGALFYGDPVDFSALQRIDLGTGQSQDVALPVYDLTVWDSRRRIEKALPELDLYHAAGHLLVPTPGGDFLFVTWRRPDGTFYTAILDLDANVPAGSLEGDRFPAGLLADQVVFWFEGEDFSLLLQPLAEVFMEGVGRNPSAR